MTRSTIVRRLLIGLACLSIPAVAVAQECTRSSGIMPYCKCIYEEALDRIRDQTGSSNVSAWKRVKAAAGALKKCMTGATDEATDEMNKV
jgi:hypothetical protein